MDVTRSHRIVNRNPPNCTAVAAATSTGTKQASEATKSPISGSQSMRKEEHASISSGPTREDVNGSIVMRIPPAGNIILEFRPEDGNETVSFLVDSVCLVKQSRYFKQLLEDTRFAEGAAVTKKLHENRTKYDHAANIPFDDIPCLEVVGLGRTSPLKGIRNVLTDLLLIIHGQVLPTRKMPLTNLANLAIVADRFDAATALAEYVRKNGILARFPKIDATEETRRQKVLIGLILNDAELVLTCSKSFVLAGSYLWVDADNQPPNDALWYDLPRRVEEELQYRRACVLGTVWSLLAACLEAYTSRTRQCRLGYDTSLQCDSFQLGELVKFLARTGYLKFTSTLTDPGGQEQCGKAVEVIMSELRECPSYQIDQHHSHCGARKLLFTGIIIIESFLKDKDIGICLECLNDTTIADPLWIGSKPLLLMSMPANVRVETPSHTGSFHQSHVMQKGMKSYTTQVLLATEKLWKF